MAMEDDVWVYTGVTSVSGDQSNVGFGSSDQSTYQRDTILYKVNGAEEYSAMGSRKVRFRTWVQGKNFPDSSEYFNEPTYFMALKDGAGLVKIRDGKYPEIPECCHRDTVSAARTLMKLLNTSTGITAGNESDSKTVTGTIQWIAQSVIDGIPISTWY